MHLLLMGLRASGKTTLGRELARHLALPFIDLDDATSALLGVAGPAEAFRTLGERAFRAGERAALERAIDLEPRVIALGGGTPTAPGAADIIRASQRAGRAFAVYLAADAETLRDRLRATDLSTRPGLISRDPIEEVGALLSERDPLYRELADVVVDVGELDVAGAVAIVAASFSGA